MPAKAADNSILVRKNYRIARSAMALRKGLILGELPPRRKILLLHELQGKGNLDGQQINKIQALYDEKLIIKKWSENRKGYIVLFIQFVRLSL
jgi:hypothetical protein